VSVVLLSYRPLLPVNELINVDSFHTTHLEIFCPSFLYIYLCVLFVERDARGCGTGARRRSVCASALVALCREP